MKNWNYSLFAEAFILECAHRYVETGLVNFRVTSIRDKLKMSRSLCSHYLYDERVQAEFEKAGIMIYKCSNLLMAHLSLDKFREYKQGK